MVEYDPLSQDIVYDLGILGDSLLHFLIGNHLQQVHLSLLDIDGISEMSKKTTINGIKADTFFLGLILNMVKISTSTHFVHHTPHIVGKEAQLFRYKLLAFLRDILVAFTLDGQDCLSLFDDFGFAVNLFFHINGNETDILDSNCDLHSTNSD